MAEIPAALMRHTVTVKTLTGTGAYGTTYADPVKVPGWLDEQIQMVRNTSGDQVVSSSAFYTRLANADLFTPGSLVTTPADDQVEVITAARRDDAGMGAWQHLEVRLT